MNRDLLIVVLILGLVLAGLEFYLVKKKGINRWILPGLVWTVAFIAALPFSANLGALPSLFQGIMVFCFYIEDYFNKRKNSYSDRVRIKNL